MRGVLQLIVAGAVLAIGVTQADAGNLTVNTSPSSEQCIQDNGEKVEAAIPDLNQAVFFLVNNLCAEPIVAEQARQMKIAADQRSGRWKKICDEKKFKQKDSLADDKSVQGTNAFCSNTAFLSETAEDTDISSLPGLVNPPASTVTFASRLLLNLRLSHLKSGTSH